MVSCDRWRVWVSCCCGGVGGGCRGVGGVTCGGSAVGVVSVVGGGSRIEVGIADAWVIEVCRLLVVVMVVMGLERVVGVGCALREAWWIA